MAFKRPLSVSPRSSQTIDNKSLSTAKSCKVCGDEARINYYGALCCQSCKTFFRRNGFHSELVGLCQHNGQCEVNMLTRKVCTSCRLAKCFAIGMSVDFIRKQYYHTKKNTSSIKSKGIQAPKSKKTVHSSQLTTMDLLRNDRSSLTASEWKLFSNVMHAYDTFSFISTLNRILENLSSPSDEARFDETDALKTIGSIYTSMQSFVSCTPDFQVLSMTEQQSLLKRNLHGIGSFCFHLVFRDAKLCSNLECRQTYIKAYGLDIIEQSQCLMKQLDPDSTLFKLMLIIIAFSSNCFIVDVHENMLNDSLAFGTFRLLGSQNIYVELLWKYMIYRYGYCDTILRFNKLIKHILDMIKHVATVYVSNVIHHDFVNELVEKTKETLVINQHELAPLWGKTLSPA